MAKNTVPRHIGFIPDGNRRWAQARGLPKQAGYAEGIEPGLSLYEICKERGIVEASIYCFTQDNTKRPTTQKIAFTAASIEFAFYDREMGRRTPPEWFSAGAIGIRGFLCPG
ncbi:MAG: hypothetical protein NTAFB09_19930 [Nitrosospira sp.]